MEPINASSLLRTGAPLWKKVFIGAFVACVVIAVLVALSEVSKPAATTPPSSNEMPISEAEKTYLDAQFKAPAPTIPPEEQKAIEKMMTTPAPEIPESQKAMLNGVFNQ